MVEPCFLGQKARGCRHSDDSDGGAGQEPDEQDSDRARTHFGWDVVCAKSMDRWRGPVSDSEVIEGLPFELL